MARDPLDTILIESCQPVSERQGDDAGAHCENPNNGNFWEKNEDHVSKKKVRKFYFVKIWPYKDTYGEFKITQAEKLIEEINQKRMPVCEVYHKIQDADLELNYLRWRESHFHSAVDWKEWKLDELQAALDKLNFAKNAAYKRGATNSSNTTSGECNFYLIQSLRYQMLHGSSNLATEKKLLKEIPRRQHDDSNSCYLVDDIKDFTQWFYGQSQVKDLTRYNNILKEIKRYEEKIDKTIANASLKGKIWSPHRSTSRNTIQDQINLVNRISEEIRKDHWDIIVDIKRLEKSSNTSGIDESTLIKQHDDIRKELYEAHECILNVRNRHKEANASYLENLPLFSQARELARKKDVVALEELSHREVEKFMSQWNNSKAFRNIYQKKILPSLKTRQLSKDGRMMSQDEESVCGLKTNQNDDFDTNIL